ncbi:MAG: N-acetyltransferase [Reyranella sp.]|nr:MAG: N-acetyltransferase [Reyranella sp.]
MPDLFAHQPAPRPDGKLDITVTHLVLTPSDWTRLGQPPDIAVTITHEARPTAAFYRTLYRDVGLPWLWYERSLISDQTLHDLLNRPGHELHVARHDGKLVGYFELGDEELVFFGLTLAYVGRRIGPWLLDRAVERAFALGWPRILLNTNTLDHAKALQTYRKAGFQIVRREEKTLQDPRVRWPMVYRWPPA